METDTDFVILYDWNLELFINQGPCLPSVPNNGDMGDTSPVIFQPRLMTIWLLGYHWILVPKRRWLKLNKLSQC